jgi:lipid-A-disaccharide synthase
METGEIALDLYITANSPGEIAGLAMPVIREIRARIRRCRVTLVIPPCQYASGEELSAGGNSGADRCVRIGDLSRIFSNPGEGVRAAKLCLVLHLGGDVVFSIYLSKKLRCPLWLYSSRPRWKFFVDRYLVPDEKGLPAFRERGIKQDRCAVIGNIALDSATLNETEDETREFLGIAPDVPVVTCLAGSRPIEYVEGVRLFAAVSRIIAKKFPQIKVLFPLASTVRDDLFRSALSASGLEWRGESRVREISLGEGKWALVIRDRTLEAINCSTLALAVPGTNNLQAAALYVPYIMVLPLDRADEYPLDGILGLLPLWLPGFRRFKRFYIKRLNERTSFVSLPNKMAGRMVAPEIRGIFEPGVVARMAIGLLESPETRREMSRTFMELTRERGAAARLSEHVAKFAGGEIR